MKDSTEAFRRWIHIELTKAQKDSHTTEFELRKRANVRYEHLQAALSLLDEFQHLVDEPGRF